MFRMLLIQGGVQLTIDDREAANLESKNAQIWKVRKPQGGGGGANLERKIATIYDDFCVF